VGAAAWALALLGRRVEARQAICVALKSVWMRPRRGTQLLPHRTRLAGPGFRTVSRTGAAEAQWRTGTALFAIHDAANAMMRFAVARHNGPKGRYGNLSRRQLKRP
jgi:hypothetical protein